MSDDTTHPEQPTFLQQFASRNGYMYHCLARPGATNYAINLQVDLAIKRKPDLVIIGATSSDRMNIVVDPDNWRAPIELKHITYEGYSCSSEQELKTGESFIVGDTIANLLESRYVSISEDKRNAIKSYVAELHDIGLQYHIDLCIMRDSINKLIQSKIPFVFIPGPQKPTRWIWLGNQLWPNDQLQPWDMPFGPSNISNHNPPQAHDMFLETLEQIAFDRELL